MPFDEEDDSLPQQPNRLGLKNVSSQKSIFESIPKKPTQEDFDKKVKIAQDKSINYKQKASELAVSFKKTMEDRTLFQNKNVFTNDLERELLSKMIQLAVEINNDPNEQEGMGSLGWITLLFKTALSLRDRNNLLEYKILQLERKLENLQTIDKKTKNE